MKLLILFLLLILTSCSKEEKFLTVYTKKYHIPYLITKEYKNNYNISIKEVTYNSNKELEHLLLVDNKEIDIIITDSSTILKHQNSRVFEYLTDIQIPNQININLKFLPLIKQYDTLGISVPFLFDVSLLSRRINNIQNKNTISNLASQVSNKNKLNFVLSPFKHNIYAISFVINSKSSKKSLSYRFINFCLEPFSQAHIVHSYGLPSFINHTERFINDQPFINSEELLKNGELLIYP